MADFIAENQEATLRPRSLSQHSLSLLSATSLTARPQAVSTPQPLAVRSLSTRDSDPPTVRRSFSLSTRFNASTVCRSSSLNTRFRCSNRKRTSPRSTPPCPRGEEDAVAPSLTRTSSRLGRRVLSEQPRNECLPPRAGRLQVRVRAGRVLAFADLQRTPNSSRDITGNVRVLLLFAALVVVLALTKHPLFDFRSPSRFLRPLQRGDSASRRRAGTLELAHVFNIRARRVEA